MDGCGHNGHDCLALAIVDDEVVAAGSLEPVGVDARLGETVGLELSARVAHVAARVRVEATVEHEAGVAQAHGDLGRLAPLPPRVVARLQCDDLLLEALALVAVGEHVLFALLLDGYDADVRGALLARYVAEVVHAALVERVAHEAVAGRRAPSEAVFDRLYFVIVSFFNFLFSYIFLKELTI